VHENSILGFFADDPTTLKRYFFVPGGLIEEGETAAQAAQRETLEETGYRIQIIENSLIESNYDFVWDGQLNLCHTSFFAGRLIDTLPRSVSDAPYHKGVAWVPIATLDETFSYHEEIRRSIVCLVAQFV
jgi:tRNA(adenine34) deaminase